MKDRTWITAGLLLLVALWTIAVLSAREEALWRVKLRPYFLIDNATLDQDIAILRNDSLLRAFRLYSVLLIAFIPVAIQKVFRRASIGIAIVAILTIPSVWYGLRMAHLAGKMVNWPAVWRDSGQKTGESPFGH